MTETLTAKLVDRAAGLGFDEVKITTAELPAEIGQHLQKFIEYQWHGDMSWMPDTLERRKTPTAMWGKATTAIILASNYGPEIDPLTRLENKSIGNISVYALNRDYHDVIKGRLKQLAGWFAGVSGEEVKVFVDTAPLMEKPLAAQAGIGWQGKHTNLVSRNFGSWLFLGVILTSAELEVTPSSGDNCGQCRACLDICPTGAIPEPYKLDARRCISYLTIEYGGHIPIEFRKPIGNRIYGCDDCLAICPWNKFAQLSKETKFSAREDLLAPDLGDLVKFDDQTFRTFFSGSPVKRIGRDRFIRNVLIAISNSERRDLSKYVKELIRDNSPHVRAMAVWALKQLSSAGDYTEIKERFMLVETDTAVLDEWEGRQ